MLVVSFRNQGNKVCDNTNKAAKNAIKIANLEKITARSKERNRDHHYGQEQVRVNLSSDQERYSEDCQGTSSPTSSPK